MEPVMSALYMALSYENDWLNSCMSGSIRPVKRPLPQSAMVVCVRERSPA